MVGMCSVRSQLCHELTGQKNTKKKYKKKTHARNTHSQKKKKRGGEKQEKKKIPSLVMSVCFHFFSTGEPFLVVGCFGGGVGTECAISHA